MKNVTIRIISDAQASKEPSPDANGDDKKDEIDPKEALKKRNARITAFSTYVTAQVLATAKTYAQVGYSRYLNLTEDYIAQTAMSNIEAHLGRFANVAASALGGAMLGAKIGGPAAPVVAAIGAVVGSVSGVLRNELSAANTLFEQSRALHEQAYSLYFNTERAGMVNYSRGTEN